MNTIKHVLLKGNESFLDHTKVLLYMASSIGASLTRNLMLVTSCIFLCQVKDIIKSDTN